MRCIPVGTGSLLVELADVSEATAFYAEARRAEELPSEGIVLGSIQVPASPGSRR